MPDTSGLTLPTELENIGSVLEGLARDQPGAAAIMAPGRPALCFSGLVDQIKKVGTALNLSGIGRGDRVAAVLPDGPEAAVAFLSIATSATFAPLNPSYTANELTSYLAQLRPKAIVVPANNNPTSREVAVSLGIKIIDLIIEDGAPAGCFDLSGDIPSYRSVQEKPRADDFALLLFSSGTTAKPKIIPICHRQWLVGVTARARRLQLEASDSTLISMPLFHAHGLFMLLSLLFAGGSVICTPAQDVHSFLRLLSRYSVTCLSASFGFLESIAAGIGPYRELIDQTNLRFIKSGSGKLRHETIDLLEQAFGVPVIEAYSSTEAGVVTANPMDPAKRKLGSVGTAVTGDVAILSSDNDFLPPNTVGEIVVRGPTVFNGYFDNPEADTSAFYKKWFKTGDAGSLDEEGYLSVAGRVGEIINRGGEKISPAEIEAALLKHPDITDAAAFPVPHRTLGAIVGAAIVLVPDSGLNKAQISPFLKDLLSPFKRPNVYLFLDKIPRNALGKIKRPELNAILDRTRQTNSGILKD